MAKTAERSQVARRIYQIAVESTICRSSLTTSPSRWRPVGRVSHLGIETIGGIKRIRAASRGADVAGFATFSFGLKAAARCAR
jgi:hypothetical protein